MSHLPPLDRILKRIVAWLPMYACYYTGELAFQIVNRWPGGWSDEKTFMNRAGVFFFNIYQRGMALSCDLNDWAGFNLWYGSEDGE